MSLTLRSAKLVPVTAELSQKFRDMKPLKNERVLTSGRAKEHAKLLEEGRFFTPAWGMCEFNGDVYRGNGNHTSHLLTACLQQANGGMDEKSASFATDYLFVKGGKWTGNEPGDLPHVEPGTIKALVEEFVATSREDLVPFFERYDSRVSVRSKVDVLGIYVGEQQSLDELSRDKIRYALAGAVKAALKDAEAFKITSKLEVDHLMECSGMRIGEALRIPQIVDAVRWIIETVPEMCLYKHIVGAQVCAEIYANHGEQRGEAIINEMMSQIENETDPAASYEALLNKKRNRPTTESLLKRGRTVVKEIVKKL